jgi:hypothetical protein
VNEVVVDDEGLFHSADAFVTLRPGGEWVYREDAK